MSYCTQCSGDPTMYQSYWKQMGDRTTVVISGWQSVSYFSDTKTHCWFLEPGFANAVTKLHNLVRNAETGNRHIVVGTGSTQLFQAVLYALCPSDAPEPMSIVSAAPFYSVGDAHYNMLCQWILRYAVHSISCLVRVGQIKVF